jgi:hypothetical protein
LIPAELRKNLVSKQKLILFLDLEKLSNGTMKSTYNSFIMCINEL